MTAMREQGIGEMLRPFVREIHLFDAYVAGTARLKDPTVLDEIAIGDKLTLLREESKFDENAIALLTDSKKKLGYIPEQDDRVFARLMDAGKLLTAKIQGIEEKGPFRRISIGIYLVDF